MHARSGWRNMARCGLVAVLVTALLGSPQPAASQQRESGGEVAAGGKPISGGEALSGGQPIAGRETPAGAGAEAAAEVTPAAGGQPSAGAEAGLGAGEAGSAEPVAGATPKAGEGASPVVQLPETVVTATRTAESIAAVPGSVTVITREEIAAQAELSSNFGEILGKVVPGLAPPTQSASTFGQTLRGRNLTVLVDGVPQSTSRDAMRLLRAIDPSVVDRVEVIRGATAIYGDGATGGIINIITRRPGTGKPSFTTDGGLSISLTHPGDSLGGRLAQSVSGKRGAFDYAVSGAFEHTGGFFDARGDRIPPDPHGQGGLADANTFDLFGKGGVDFGRQRLQLSVNHFHTEQDTDFTTDPSVDALPREPETKARAIGGLQLDDPQGTENTIVNLEYTHRDVLGSRLHGQVYYRDYMTRFFPFDGRAFASLGNAIIQSRIESEKVGGRLEIETPLPRRLTALWGVDIVREETSQPVSIMDPAVFDASGGLVFRKVGERTWVPLVDQLSLGLFAQLEWQAIERWLLLRAGVRQEEVGVSVDGFTTLAGNAVRGGELDYDATLFNAGAVVSVTEAISLFANFSQGFSLVDIGRTLRDAPAGFSVEQLRPEAQRVDNYEVGVRGTWRRAQVSLAYFYSKSDLGSTFNADLRIVRAPERIQGIEATVDVQPLDRLRLGGTVTWVEGENDPDRDGNYTPLDGFRIPPPKLTVYVEHVTVPRWRWVNRLQVLYSGDRDRAFNAGVGFGGRKVEDYTVADLISSVQLGPGMLRVGVENLLNNQYFPVVSQLETGNSLNAAGRGATVSVGYSVTY